MSLESRTVKKRTINWHIQALWLNALPSTHDKEKKHKSFRLSKTTRYLLAITIVVIILASVFSALIGANNKPSETPDPVEPQTTVNPTELTPAPTNQTPNVSQKPASTFQPEQPKQDYRNFIPYEYPPSQTGIIGAYPTMDSTVWREVARKAWSYFEPGNGVDSATGLPSAVFGWPYLTDWDLGVYLQAIVDAQKLGFLGKEGDWGATSRLNRVLTFLETRQLNQYNYPFWFYQSNDGKMYPEISNQAKTTYDLVDTGMLFVALGNIKRYNPEFGSRIDGIVFNGRSDYAALLPDVQSEFNRTNLYAYLISTGFSSFWPAEVGAVPKQIISNIRNSGEVSVNSEFGGKITIPQARISGEGLLNSVLILDVADQQDRDYLFNLSKQVYLAHEEYHNLTGRWVAFSEGNAGSGLFVYEWVYLPGYGSWKITSLDRTKILTINPIIYSKVALSFLALFNTSYARDLSIYLENCLPAPTNGWAEGADYTLDISSRNIISGANSNTNGMILAASRYFIQKYP